MSRRWLFVPFRVHTGFSEAISTCPRLGTFRYAGAAEEEVEEVALVLCYVVPNPNPTQTLRTGFVPGTAALAA